MRLLIFVLACLAHFVNAYHVSVASAGVSFTNENNLDRLPQATNTQIAAAKARRNRRMYAMCPPHFQRIGTECYSLLPQPSSWLEAHFFCKDKNSKLAEPQKNGDRKLRVFLKQYDAQFGFNDPIWIGATYDWQSNVWQWSISGKNLTYDAFSRMEPEIRQSLENHCAVYDPNLDYRWSARPCPDKFRFICQHKMPKVSEKNRLKVYNRWNATYPHEFANEVILEVMDHPGKNGPRSNVIVKAVGSDEQIIIPNTRIQRQRGNHTRGRGRHHQARRRPTRPTTQTSVHPNEIDTESTDKSTHDTPLAIAVRFNDISPPSTAAPVSGNNAANGPRRPSQQRTPHDRAVWRQRQKELRRLQRKKERSQRMQQEKERRLTEQRQRIRENQIRLQQEKQRQRQQEEQDQQEQQDQQQKSHEQPEHANREVDELRQREAADQNRQRQQQQQAEAEAKRLADEARQRGLETLKTQLAEEKKLKQEDNSAERIRQMRISRQREHEQKERMEREEALRKAKEEHAKEEAKREQERLEKEKQQREEYEERLKQIQDERERELHERQERKRIEDEHNRKLQEEQEKKRQEEIQRQQDEEEKLLEMQRLEAISKFEKHELERLEKENRLREERLQKRQEEIERREQEQRKIEEEEERLKKEVEETERQRKEEYERQIKQEEEALKAREEAEHRAAEKQERERQERFKLLKEQEDIRLQAERKRNYAERLARLSPEAQRAFFEERKKRKARKMQELLRQKQQAKDGNEAFEEK